MPRPSQVSFDGGFQKLLHCVKHGEGDRKGDRSFHPVDRHALEESSQSLFRIQRLNGRDQTGGSGQHSVVGTNSDIPKRGVIPDQSECLHPPSCHFNGVCDRLCKQSRHSTALHPLDGSNFPAGHKLDLPRNKASERASE